MSLLCRMLLESGRKQRNVSRGATRRTTVLVMALLAASGCGGENPSAKSKPSNSPSANSGSRSSEPSARQTEISVELVDAAGYQAVLDRHKGKAIVVDFWATWCIPCRENFPHTVAWHKKYSPDDLAVISLAMDDPDPEVQQQVLEFLKEQGATFTNLCSSLGGEEEGMEAFDIESGAVPHYKVYDRDGKLVAKFDVDPDKPLKLADIDAAIEQAVAR